MLPEEMQNCLRQAFLADPSRCWDSRRYKQHPDYKHKESEFRLWLNNRQKPPWVGVMLGNWEAGMKRPPESVSTPGQAQGVFATDESHLEVEMCSKLCQDGPIVDAVHALDLLVQRGCPVHNNLFYRVLKRCIANKDLVLGRRVHALVIKSGYGEDAFLATHLIGLYASHGRLEEAMGVFTKVSTPDAYAWATIIFACARHGEAAEAIRLYRQMRYAQQGMGHEALSLYDGMQQEGLSPPDCVAFACLLQACASVGVGALHEGKQIHAQIEERGLQNNVVLGGSLVNMYAKCSSVEDARSIFDRLSDRNVVTWNAIISGYAQQGMGEEALSLYHRMRQEDPIRPTAVTFTCLLQACASVGIGALQEGKQIHAQIVERGLQGNVVLGGSLVNMYAKCGSLVDARSLFDRLPDRNVETWNAMLAGYAQLGMGQEVLHLYGSMQQEGNPAPNSVTFVCLLQACAIVAGLPMGKQLHGQIEERRMQADVVVGGALVNMYAKCGSMIDAHQVFDSLPERTVEAWGALLDGYSRQGDSEVVFDLLDRMRLDGIQPDGVTFLSVLTVCSHVGLVDKGLKYFEVMSTECGISPTVDHYICMMDLLGRAGHLDEALQMAKTMPFPPTHAVWHTLLGACRKWNNVEIGQQAFELAMRLDGKDAASYVLMSTIYARAEMWDEAKEMQARRKKIGAWKEPGECWWPGMGGLVHMLEVWEHPDSDGIDAGQDQLVRRMENEGYVYAAT